MDKEINNQRVNHLYQMLMEMASGNFSYRIPRTEQDDELETLTVLINWMAEEIQESIFHTSYINPHFTYRYLIQSTFILNSDFIINDFSTDIPSLLGIESNEIFGKDFTEILEKESLPLWQTAKDKLLNDTSYHTTLSLKFVTPKKLFIPTFCSVSKLLKDRKVIVSTFNAIMEQTIENKNTVQEVFNEEEKGTYNYLDVQLIQSVYDFILMHKNTSFPTLKELARIFGTNEYKLKVGFRYLFKTSIYKFYNNERLKRSHLLIKHTKIPLKNIAIMVGFSTYPNFSRAFKIKFGCSPTEISRKSS